MSRPRRQSKRRVIERSSIAPSDVVGYRHFIQSVVAIRVRVQACGASHTLDVPARHFDADKLMDSNRPGGSWGGSTGSAITHGPVTPPESRRRLPDAALALPPAIGRVRCGERLAAPINPSSVSPVRPSSASAHSCGTVRHGSGSCRNQICETHFVSSAGSASPTGSSAPLSVARRTRSSSSTPFSGGTLSF